MGKLDPNAVPYIRYLSRQAFRLGVTDYSAMRSADSARRGQYRITSHSSSIHIRETVMSLCWYITREKKPADWC